MAAARRPQRNPPSSASGPSHQSPGKSTPSRCRRVLAYVATIQIQDFQVLDMLAGDRQLVVEVQILIAKQIKP